MSELPVEIRQLPGTEDLPLPAYKTEHAAGLDLFAAVAADRPVVLGPGERAAIPTGIAIAVPPGYEAQVRGRSGLARDFGIGLTNGIGTIDADYRGEIQVLLVNHGREPFTVTRGTRIAQLVVAPVVRVRWVVREELDETERGAGGFGHTGHR